MNISKKLRMMMCGVIAAILILILLSVFFIGRMNGIVKEYSDEWTPSIVYTGILDQYLLSLRNSEAALIMTEDAGVISKAKEQFTEYLQAIDEYIAYIRDIHPEMADRIQEKVDVYLVWHDKIVGAVLTEHNKAAAMGYFEQSYTDFFDATTAIEEDFDAETAEAEAGVASAQQAFTVCLILMILFGLAVAAAVIVGLRRVIVDIMTPLNELNDVAKAIGEGDLNQHIEYTSTNEFGELAENFNRTVVSLSEFSSYIEEIARLLHEISEGNLALRVNQSFDGEFRKVKHEFDNISSSLNATMSELSNSSENVAMGAEQMAIGSQSLSQGATEQASSVEELAATITQISEQIQSTAKNAEEAQTMSEKNGAEMAVSMADMKEMIQAMERISETSGKIENIIKTIEDIAFQTNILALNASVEAARAGTAGKGFAVVADEVRNLATKSAEAAQQTSLLITSSLEAVKSGSEIADRTASSMNSVAEASGKITVIIDEISKASREQAIAIRQVTDGVDQIATVVQTSSATAEQSAASSEELASQAQMLKNLVGRFNFEHQ